MMSQIKSGASKNLRKGECLFKEGTPATRPYLIQSGLVSVLIATPSGPVELYQATAPQVIGLEALDGTRTYQSSAIALNDTTVQEIQGSLLKELPTHPGKSFFNNPPEVLKAIAIGLVNKHKVISDEIRKIKSSERQLPCPPELAPKLFATLFHVASYTGEHEGEMIKVVWPAFQKYCQRVFLESPVRLENAIYLLKGMGYATLEMIKSETDPEAPEELGFVRFKNIQHLESLSEFLRKRKNWSLEPNDPCLKAGEALLRACGTSPVKLNEAIATLATEMGTPSFSRRDLENLIANGLPVTISGAPPAEDLSFDPNEIKAMFRSWKFLVKLNEWNRLGKVPGKPEPEPETKRRAAS